MISQYTTNMVIKLSLTKARTHQDFVIQMSSVELRCGTVEFSEVMRAVLTVYARFWYTRFHFLLFLFLYFEAAAQVKHFVTQGNRAIRNRCGKRKKNGANVAPSPNVPCFKGLMRNRGL